MQLIPVFGDFFFSLSFFPPLIGNQSPADVHVVPESTASLWSFSGRAKRCVSLEIPSMVHTILGKWEHFLLWHQALLFDYLLKSFLTVSYVLSHLYCSPLKTSSDVSLPRLHWVNFLQNTFSLLWTQWVFLVCLLLLYLRL